MAKVTKYDFLDFMVDLNCSLNSIHQFTFAKSIHHKFYSAHSLCVWAFLFPKTQSEPLININKQHCAISRYPVFCLSPVMLWSMFEIWNKLNTVPIIYRKS